jgi:exodeoxyribonuclease V
MELNTDQRIAVDACAASIRSKQAITRLFGYAGTGKTTIASTIVEETGIDPSRVLFAAPTGKAAAVLTRKGSPAKTIHSLLYHPPEKIKEVHEETDEFFEHYVSECSLEMCGRKPKHIKDEFRWTIDDTKTYLASRASLLVLDEASMIGNKLGTDIMSLGIPVLAIGDPAQLQPVNDKQFFMDQEPTAQLEQIMRNSGMVLRCAQDIRRNGVRAIHRYRDITLGQVGQSVALEYSQIIVGKNRTRDLKNAKVRQLRGFSGDKPMVGERIICLRNNYGLGCLNGQQFTVTEVYETEGAGWRNEGMFTAYLKCDCGTNENCCPICGWNSNKLMPIWLKGFAGFAGEKELADMPYQQGNRAMMATYGYCITAHKSQGSEWPSVLVINEAWGKEKVNWLYTAVTRAENEVAIINPTGK